MVYTQPPDEYTNIFELQAAHYREVYGDKSYEIDKSDASKIRDALRFTLPECHECLSSSGLVEDRKNGTLVCQDCGLVIEDTMIDLGQEWRTFSGDDEKAGADMNRAGEAVIFGKGDQLQTNIGSGDGKYVQSLHRSQARSSLFTEEDKANKKLQAAMPRMIQFLDMLGLSFWPGTRATAEQTLVYCHDKGFIKPKPTDEEIAAVIFNAAKTLQAPVSLQNVCDKVLSKGNERSTWRKFKKAQKQVQQAMILQFIDQKADKLAKEKALVTKRECLKQQQQDRQKELRYAMEKIKSEDAEGIPPAPYSLPSSRRAKKQYDTAEEETKAAIEQERVDGRAAAQAALFTESVQRIEARKKGWESKEGDNPNFNVVIEQAKDFIGKWMDNDLYGVIPYWMKGISNSILDVVNELYIWPSRRPEYMALTTLWLTFTLTGNRISFRKLNEYPGMPNMGSSTMADYVGIFDGYREDALKHASWPKDPRVNAAYWVDFRTPQNRGNSPTSKKRSASPDDLEGTPEPKRNKNNGPIIVFD